MCLTKTLEEWMSMLVDNLIIEIYLTVDEFLTPLGSLRKSGPQPKLTDAEVLTMEIIGETLKIGTDKGIFDYFYRHWKPWFPGLGCRTTFTRQIAHLWSVKKKLQQHLVQKMSPFTDLFLFDGFPIPTCHIKRYKRSKTELTSHGSVGYCAAKDEKYFGFKGHLVTTQQGLIVNFTFSQAHVDERDVLPELTRDLQGDLIADKGLIRPELTKKLASHGLTLHTPLRANMKDKRPKAFVTKLLKIRRRIETVISQLAQRFSIQSVRAKDLWHLTSKISRKILSHTFCFFLAKSMHFNNIVTH